MKAKLVISTSPPLAVRGNIEGLRYLKYYLWFSLKDFKDTPHDCSELSKHVHKTKLILRKGPVLAPYGAPPPVYLGFLPNWNLQRLDFEKLTEMPLSVRLFLQEAAELWTKLGKWRKTVNRNSRHFPVTLPSRLHCSVNSINLNGPLNNLHRGCLWKITDLVADIIQVYSIVPHPIMSFVNWTLLWSENTPLT